MKTVITVLYGMSGFIIAGMYVPQAISAFRTRGAGISVLAWTGWTFTSVTASLYAWFIVQDTLFFTLSCLNAIGCAAVLSSRFVRG
ncbi:MAG: hypothetical protein L0Z73_07030 [Gammaproteobacteria bacterium]|nr:hypothetical protein [Gammaproteobacteria bacterium]